MVGFFSMLADWLFVFNLQIVLFQLVMTSKLLKRTRNILNHLTYRSRKSIDNKYVYFYRKMLSRVWPRQTQFCDTLIKKINNNIFPLCVREKRKKRTDAHIHLLFSVTFIKVRTLKNIIYQPVYPSSGLVVNNVDINEQIVD